MPGKIETVNGREKASTIGVRNPDIIRERISTLHDIDGLSFRAIHETDEFYPIPPGTLCSIYNGYPIPKKWYKHLNLPYSVEVQACPDCGNGHAVGWCVDKYGEPVKPKRNGRPPRKRQPPIRIGEATDEELEAIKTYLTTDERRAALVEAANKKRRS